MMKDLRSAMMASISDVLETMFYMPLECDDCVSRDKQAAFDSPDLRVCRLDFEGALKGHVIMMIPETLLVIMAVDFMGEERKNITRHHSDGVIKEVLNMVVGHMFSNLDNKAEYHLGIPEIVEASTIIDGVRNEPPEGTVFAESIDGVIISIIRLDH